MINKIILLGNVGADPVMQTHGDSLKATISIATKESWKKDGVKHESTQWHTVVFWGNLVDVIQKYVKKGDLIYIEGLMKSTKYQDNTGNEKYFYFVDGKKMKMLPTKRDNNEVRSETTTSGIDYQNKDTYTPEDIDFNDDIPF